MCWGFIWFYNNVHKSGVVIKLQELPLTTTNETAR